MPGLALMLKALGIKITPEVLAQIEALLPQIPAKINAVLQFLREFVQRFDTRSDDQTERLKRIELELLELRKLLEVR